MDNSKTSAAMNIFPQLDLLLTAQRPAHNPASFLAQLGTPSVSFAFLDKDTIHAHCISSQCDDEATLFQACSISKPATALAVFRLIDQGKLSLDCSIADYLPAADVELLETTQTRGLAKYISIRQLVSHTSGLDNGSPCGFRGYETRDALNKLPDLRTVLRGQPPANAPPIILKDWPGHRFIYSGAGLVVLQLVLEKAVGLPFEAIMQHYVFGPLGMDRSRYTPPVPKDINGLDVPGQQGRENYARAYYSGWTPCEVSHRVNPELATAGLWSTPTDLLKMARAVQQSLREVPNSFLSPAAARTMLTEVQDGMAHGWFVSGESGLVFKHAGNNVPGWECNLICYTGLDPNEMIMTSGEPGGYGIAVMTNSAEGFIAYGKIMAAICYLKNWPSPPRVWADPEIVIPLADPHAGVNPHWAEWEGRWEGGWALIVLEGRTCASFQGMPPVKLYVAAQGIDGRPDQGDALDVVCGGLEIMLRLIRSPEERTIQVWNGSTQDKRMLRRI